MELESEALPMIEAVEKAVTRGKPKADGAKLKRFAHHLLANVPPDDLRHKAPENLAGAVEALFHYAEQRKPGKAKIRIYNPTTQRDGWDSPHSVVEIVNDDMSFLVDSVTAELQRQELEVRLVIHPIFASKRDAAGRLKDIAPPGDRYDGAIAESIMQIWVAEVPEDRHGKVIEELASVLQDVRLAVTDWRHMRQRCRDLIDELEQKPPPLAKAEVREALAFLEWLEGENFTFLGYREYSFSGRGGKAVSRILPDSGLGILRDEDRSVFDGLRSLGTLPPDVQDFVRRPELLRITKANRRSTVHRPVLMDTIAVKSFNARGEVVGERLMIGLFTSVAYSMSPREIPILRQKAQATLERAGFSPASHDGKALIHILETYPRDELFQITEDDLYRTAIGILHLQERKRVALFVRHDPFERFISAFVYVPRDRFDTKLRLRLQRYIAKAYGGEVSVFNVQMSDAALARLHVTVETKPGQVPKVDVERLEQKLADAARSWGDQLEQALTAARGEMRGLGMAKRFAGAFAAAYKEQFTASDAVDDIARVERVMAGAPLAMQLYQPDASSELQVGFKLYVPKQPIALSDILPVLENMGLKVVSEVPYPIRLPKEGLDFWLHDFGMQFRQAQELSLDAIREDFHEVFARIWSGRMENDGLNRLVLRAGLGARQIIVLRAYARYLRQAKAPFTQETIEQTLANNPAITCVLVRLFEARFDPARGKGREETEAELVAEAKHLLEGVANLDEDRVFRRYLNLIRSSLRTNFYQPADGRGPEQPGEEKAHLSIKLDSKAIDELPLPRPYREIFIYSARVEGVHLRFGPVARGGLRWSDRRDDFRTEILGLVKAQNVKNAVIVPVGSKGGFVLKHAPPPTAPREVIQAEGVACYKTFLRGLLDLTDNRVGKKIEPPKHVVRHDGDDPYLVVAADKGTATFSDIANGVSADYGFWLGDAFASGGSAGYDHKAMGITAKGAWESVKRHFRELGKDIQAQDFTVAGVGDMSGDVFGNGMLLSPHIKLLAAFDHRHVFVDPDPDPAASLAERRRLFQLPRSSWADYDPALISKGGGVFDRKLKAIKTTPEIRRALGMSEESLTPSELIRHVLLAPVELLWFGGIGTYVKASEESQGDVGDRANDAVRINGRDVRARVVGEGANLGVTQLGRVEFSLAGGRCNTDSIDNSAGVDCSDHEVNIKILLGEVERSGKLSRPQRDELLREMTDEVAALVLTDNYLQTQAISVTEKLGGHLLDRHARFMRSLEK
ncbi:MAG TPA: NAD-glutamate dehydrogenase, partial [Kiloniellales bacterium]|nr:NAD-glutamate dehydrogenase [Kiloniellales bacterium]